jgi:hypothetical protein
MPSHSGDSAGVFAAIPRALARSPSVELHSSDLRSSGPIYKHGNCRTSGLIVCADLELVVTSIDQISMPQRLRSPRHKEVQLGADLTSRSVEQTSIWPRSRPPDYWATREHSGIESGGGGGGGRMAAGNLPYILMKFGAYILVLAACMALHYGSLGVPVIIIQRHSFIFGSATLSTVRGIGAVAGGRQRRPITGLADGWVGGLDGGPLRDKGGPSERCQDPSHCSLATITVLTSF